MSFEERGELKWNQTKVLLLISLLPYCYALLAHAVKQYNAD